MQGDPVAGLNSPPVEEGGVTLGPPGNPASGIGLRRSLRRRDEFQSRFGGLVQPQISHRFIPPGLRPKGIDHKVFFAERQEIRTKNAAQGSGGTRLP